MLLLLAQSIRVHLGGEITAKLKCLAQERNPISSVRTRTQTARSGNQYTNHEATAPTIKGGNFVEKLYLFLCLK